MEFLLLFPLLLAGLLLLAVFAFLFPLLGFVITLPFRILGWVIGLFGWVLLLPLILVFLEVGGLLGTLALMAVGFCVVGTFGITIVLSQLYLPQRTGMASGIAVGLAMGIGGVAAVALGGLADSVDLETALIVAACAPAIGVVLCLFLPSPARTAAPDAALAQPA